MKKIVTELFDCLFELPEDFFDRVHVKENIEKQDTIMEEILEVLPDTKKKLVYEYEIALHDAMQDEVVGAFRQGIKIGFYLKNEIHEK
ncbi:MAG: hypothetical protein ACK5LC_11030 [Coprobacillaceae bacterium]